MACVTKSNNRFSWLLPRIEYARTTMISASRCSVQLCSVIHQVADTTDKETSSRKFVLLRFKGRSSSSNPKIDVIFAIFFLMGFLIRSWVPNLFITSISSLASRRRRSAARRVCCRPPPPPHHRLPAARRCEFLLKCPMFAHSFTGGRSFTSQLTLLIYFI
ncbi:unnamed protein product [Trichogramma brassicae]|uniref:Uncharacterized protein n=1 Tax=Trichogramma brassicae TaxID=86971 RepID=A0A6H5IHH5_9HYME|nr:unnamed protein product [Trichogramma brassicae]